MVKTWYVFLVYQYIRFFISNDGSVKRTRRRIALTISSQHFVFRGLFAKKFIYTFVTFNKSIVSAFSCLARFVCLQMHCVRRKTASNAYCVAEPLMKTTIYLIECVCVIRFARRPNQIFIRKRDWRYFYYKSLQLRCYFLIGNRNGSARSINFN